MTEQHNFWARRTSYVLICILAFVGLTLLLDKDVYCRHEHTAYEYCASDYLTLNVVRRIAELFDAFNGVVASLAAVAVAAFTLTLKMSTDKLWISAEKQHMISNRAFVFVSILQCNELIAGGLSVLIVFKNGGTTPTKNMTSNVNAEVRPGDLPNDHTYPGRAGEDVRASIGPQAEVGVNQLIFTADQFQSVLHESHRLFIWGKAEYQDVFDNTPVRETRFAYELVAKADGKGVHFMRFAQYGTYNETT